MYTTLNNNYIRAYFCKYPKCIGGKLHTSVLRNNHGKGNHSNCGQNHLPFSNIPSLHIKVQKLLGLCSFISLQEISPFSGASIGRQKSSLFNLGGSGGGVAQLSECLLQLFFPQQHLHALPCTSKLHCVGNHAVLKF